MHPKFRQSLKSLLPPRVFARISAARWWNYVLGANAKNGMREVCRRLLAYNGNTVRQGPFSGLKLTEECLLSLCNSPALLGTYEMELHPWFFKMEANKYDRIIDIGAAEGYYAVGMALRTGSTVDAYEAAPVARRFCQSIAKLNGLSNHVRIHSYCSQKVLLKLDGLRCFVLSDCEGFEVFLFSGDVIRALSRSDLIIELHDRGASRTTVRQVLESRLKGTHNVQVVRSRTRTLSDFPGPQLMEVLGADAIRTLSEGRSPNQEWIVATPLETGVVRLSR